MGAAGKRKNMAVNRRQLAFQQHLETISGRCRAESGVQQRCCKGRNKKSMAAAFISLPAI
ncbi:hypothetical protein [Cupriavidus sp. L7L]|uniref:hypothetical protein n=1 Tax=Cupriavidus sp. L7L TaxID=2546443 RepID=UPI001056DA58|nr:hypothetical protein [Cupriavidus sp. L7L]TDF64352.1 hypothetical protein E1J61_19160 [Cupriavidus sp. L7L]